MNGLQLRRKIKLTQLSSAYSRTSLSRRDMVLAIPASKTSTRLELIQGKPMDLLDHLVDLYGDDMGLESEHQDDLLEFLQQVSSQMGVQLYA